MSYKIENISLEHMIKTDWISVRAINICRKNQLTDLNKIIAFYTKHGTFKKLKNCGDKTEKELSEICRKFIYSLDVPVEIKESIPIKEPIRRFTNDEIEAINEHVEYLVFKLSVRARNGLQKLFNGTPKAFELIEKFYSPTFSFQAVRNIGDKTIEELDNFKKALFNFLQENQLQDSNTIIAENLQLVITTSSVADLRKIINDFNPFKKAALNRHIEYLISNLKIRARNGITKFFGEALTAKQIIETIFSHSFDFQDIKNIGSKTVSELHRFKADISSFIETLRFIGDNHLNREHIKLIIKTTFSNLPLNFDEQFEMFFEATGKIKLFKLIYFLIENDHILRQKEKQLFYFLYTESYSKSLDQIAIELEIGKERLRQIRIDLEDKIQDYFRFILSFNSQDLITYNISKDICFKIINNDFIQKINTTENVNFNVLFYSIIFGLFLENSHSVLGDDENISGKGNYSNIVRYKNCYLIETKIFTLFNFEAFANDINLSLSNRILETYALHFEGYLLQFMNLGGRQYLPVIKEICETIIYNEFDLVISNDGYIIFERNVKKPLVHYTFEILEMLGQMTKVEEITRALNEKYPELDITEQSLRSTLQRERELFIKIGRTSTYGLKKWELENESLKGGTIRDIAEEFLKKYDTPQHTYDIVNYVKQYRNTSSVSIFRNIQAEDNNRFVFFSGGYVGLKNKRYAPSDTVFKKVAGTNFRQEVLKKFNGWDYDKLVNHYMKIHHYTRVQVINLLETKIQAGEIILNDDNSIKI